jgi:hypothetical protein
MSRYDPEAWRKDGPPHEGEPPPRIPDDDPLLELLRREHPERMLSTPRNEPHYGH